MVPAAFKILVKFVTTEERFGIFIITSATFAPVPIPPFHKVTFTLVASVKPKLRILAEIPIVVGNRLGLTGNAAISPVTTDNSTPTGAGCTITLTVALLSFLLTSFCNASGSITA